MDEWENELINAWGQWLPAVRNLGDLVGSVLGVDSGTVAILPNVSTVQSFVASCFEFPVTSGRFKGRNKVVYDDLNFSTVHYVWQEQARRGAEITVVKSKDGIHAPIDELCAAIDEKTLLSITGNHAENPTLDLPCRHVFARGQKDVQVIGPVAAMEEKVAALHRRYWRSK